MQKWCHRCDEIVKNPRKVTKIRTWQYLPTMNVNSDLTI